MRHPSGEAPIEIRPHQSRDLRQVAARHITNILKDAICHLPPQPAAIVYDQSCPLSAILADAYRACLPEASTLAFQTDQAEYIRDRIFALPTGALVILIQSDRFRLGSFRFRMELYKADYKVIEHPHLGRIRSEEYPVYIDALAYDPEYYRHTGKTLKKLVDTATSGEIRTPSGLLTFASGFEPARLNVGDYENMSHIGGQFPIGEVFTESRHLDAVSGTVSIASFGDREFQVNRPPDPIILVIENGEVCHTRNSTREFDRILTGIRHDEDVVLVRELGLGLNRAMSEHRIVSDIGSYERMLGIHLSLGAKHHSYPKAGIRKKSARHHVDVFLYGPELRLDGKVIFGQGKWMI